MKKVHPVEEYEAGIIARAAYFTAFVQVGPRMRFTQERPTQAEAEDVGARMAAESGRAVLIYAVTAEGRQALAATIRPPKGVREMLSAAERQSLDLANRAVRGALKPDEKAAPKAPKKKPAAKASAPATDVPAKSIPQPAPGGARPPPRRPPLDAPAAPKMRKAAAAAVEAAQKGILPSAPDFSAETHKRFRPKLAELEALVAAKDIAGLKAYPISPISTSPKALDRFRNLAVMALEAQATSPEIV